MGREMISSLWASTEARSTATVVVASRHGRLCNRLLTFANLISASLEFEFPVVNASFCDYADMFQMFSGTNLCRFPVRFGIGIRSRTTRVALRNAFRVMEMCAQHKKTSGSLLHAVTLGPGGRLYLDSKEFLEQVHSHRYVFLSGLEFVDRRFKEKFPLIKSHFMPRADYLRQVLNVTRDARGKSDLLIGIHARRGDYRTYRNGEWFYDWPVYVTLMHDLVHQFSGRSVSFLVVSDEQVPHSLATGLNCVSSNHREIVDLYALAHCDYIAGAPSSFSAWASLYGGVPLCHIRSPNQRPESLEFKPLTKVW